MTEKEAIQQTIKDFVKGGDKSDVVLLDRVLHKDFRVTNNGFMDTMGVTIIDKKEYLHKITTGAFGGIAREMEILSCDWSYKIASVKLRIVSPEFDFISYNSLVLDTENHWKIINNLAIVTPRK